MLPPVPTLSGNDKQDIQALWLWANHVRTSLKDFAPSQVAAALDIEAVGYTPRSPFAQITLPVSPPTPDTPTGLEAIGFYKQIGLTWDLDPSPYISGWEVQRADDLAFTVNVTTLTSARALAFVDSGLADNTTYYYRIRAVALDGVTSGFTSVKSATTLANDSTVLTQLDNGLVFLQRAHLALAIIDSAHIGNAQILTAHIADLQVTTAKIALLAVTTALIADAAITNAKIGNLEVTDAKIASVAADKITAGTIDVLIELTNQTIKLDGGNSLITITDTQGSPKIRVKIGKLGSGSSDYGIQVFNAAGTTMFDTLNSGVTSSGILDAAVITNKLNDLAVTTGKLNDLVVTAAKIAAAAVETAKVAASAITALNSAAESIETITSTSATDIGNLTITYTTSAAEGPHMLFFSGETRIKNTHATNTQDIGYRIDVLYDGGLVHRIFGAWPSIAAGKEVITSPGLAFMTTGISAGSHTWKLQGRVLGSDQELTVSGLVGSTSALLTLAEMKK